MARLIDGDALIEKFNEKVDMAECLIDARTAERFATFCALADAVEEMPTADAEVVVKCEDCIKRYDTDECPMCFVSDGKYYEFTEDDGFCDRGERKEE